MHYDLSKTMNNDIGFVTAAGGPLLLTWFNFNISMDK